MPRKPHRPPALRQQIRRLGARFRAARLAAGLTQVELVEAMGPNFGYTGQWVSELESGRNGIDAIALQAVARAVGRPIGYFLDDNFDVTRPLWPTTLYEWTLMAGGDQERARAHYELDQSLSK